MSSNPYGAGLALLARRELSAAQVAERLRRRGFDDAEVDAAVARLRREGAVDDRRTAAAHARRLAAAAHRGPLRAEREVAALGIDPAVARAAVAEVYAEHDARAVLERALARRLPPGEAVADRVHFGRLHRFLVRQGFEPRMVTAALRGRAAAAAAGNDAEPS